MRNNKRTSLTGSGLSNLKNLRLKAQQQQQALAAKPQSLPAGIAVPASVTPTRAPVPSITQNESFATLLQQDQKSTAEGLSTSDQRLFRQTMRQVTPLTRSLRQLQPAAALCAEQALVRQQHALGNEERSLSYLDSSDAYIATNFESDPAEYLNPVCGPDVLSNLKRGRWAIQSHLDLHGATLDEARLLVASFISESLEYGFKCIRIVHGIGYGSKGDGPVLLPTVRRWLGQMYDVLAFTECDAHEGGKGAVKILLRRYVR